MTTSVSNIITRAYRESNIIPMGTVPTINQQTEALDLLNTLLLSSIGNEIGTELTDLNIGGVYDESGYVQDWVPANARMLLNLSGTQTLNLNPNPYNGMRLAFVDVLGNLAIFPMTLNGNGRLVEGVTSLVLNVNSDSREWMYRADIGQWVKLTTLLYADNMPFPQKYDHYFITMLAMRLDPRYGQTLSNESMLALKRSRNQIMAAYRNVTETYPDYAGHLGPNRDSEFKVISSWQKGRFWWR